MPTYERIVYIPDVHCGDQDSRAVELAIKIIKYLKPTKIIQLGDFVDFLGLSSFEAGVSSPYTAVQRELDIAHDILDAIRTASPKSTKIMIEGNHEHRLSRWLSRNPAFQKLNALRIEDLLKLKEFGWDDKLYKRLELNEGAFLVKHGNFIQQDAGQSAKKELMSSLSSGISGHTHRIGQYSYRSKQGLLQWTETGCLQNNAPSWKDDVQNWQHGIAIGEHEENGNAFSVTPVPFRLSYKATVFGKEIV